MPIVDAKRALAHTPLHQMPQQQKFSISFTISPSLRFSLQNAKLISLNNIILIVNFRSLSLAVAFYFIKMNEKQEIYDELCIL